MPGETLSVLLIGQARQAAISSARLRPASWIRFDRIPDFDRAYEPDGLAIEEVDAFGPTARTLRGFIRSYHDLIGAIPDVVLPDPDVRPAQTR